LIDEETGKVMKTFALTIALTALLRTVPANAEEVALCNFDKSGPIVWEVISPSTGIVENGNPLEHTSAIIITESIISWRQTYVVKQTYVVGQSYREVKINRVTGEAKITMANLAILTSAESESGHCAVTEAPNMTF
jgi:hypothetical protein